MLYRIIEKEDTHPLSALFDELFKIIDRLTCYVCCFCIRIQTIYSDQNHLWRRPQFLIVL